MDKKEVIGRIVEQLGISKLDLKRQNRMQILKVLKQKGPTSRIDIAKTLELTRATVTIITNELINQNVLAEVGEAREHPPIVQRGRKKILIDINESYKFAIGVAVEKGAVSVGLSTLFGHVLDKRILKLSAKISFADIIEFIKSSVKDVLSYNCLELSDTLGIGIGVTPCMYGKMKLTVKNDKLMTNALTSELADLGKVSIIVDSYIKGAAEANIDFQKEKSEKRENIAFLSYGNDFHFGVTNLNEPVKRYDNKTGFVDNIVINTQKNINGQNFGSVKSEITPHAVKLKVKAVMSKDKTPYLYNLLKGDIDNLTPSLFFTALDSKDDTITSIYNNTVNLIAVLLNNLIYSTNPQRIVLHNFTIFGEHIGDIKTALCKIAGENIASMLDISIITRKNSFLAGCALAIRELFYSKGAL